MSKFYSYIDLTKNELRNAAVQNLASDPGTGGVGQVYYNTTSSKLRICTNATGPVWADVAGSAGGDFSSNTATSVDSEVVLFSGTGGKTGKRSTGTGIPKLTSGVLSIATSGTDYAPGTSANTTGLVKSTTTTGALTTAVQGTDYYAPGGTDVAIVDGGTGVSTLPTGILKGAGTGAITAATSGTDYSLGTSALATGIVKSTTTTGALTIAVAGTDYLAPAGSGAALTGITESQVTNLVSDLALKAPLASPTFTGTVTVPTPVAGTDATTKNYVDAARSGISVKDPVRTASTANVTLASALVNGLVMDGVTLATGDRVLLKDQSTGSQNGIYVVVASGAASRSTDADTSAELVPGSAVWVNEGTVNGDSRWVLTTNAPITLDTTTLVWTKDFQASDVVGGAGLTKTGSTLDVGQGTGITVAADTISIDTAVVARKATGLIGNASATSFAVTTGLTASAIGAHVFSVTDAGTGEIVYPNITHTSTTVVTVDFGSTVPTSNQFRWMQVA